VEQWSSKESSVTRQYPLKRLQPLIIHRDSWVRKQLTFGGVIVIIVIIIFKFFLTSVGVPEVGDKN